MYSVAGHRPAQAEETSASGPAGPLVQATSKAGPHSGLRSGQVYGPRRPAVLPHQPRTQKTSFAVLRGYRGFLPLQQQRKTRIQAEKGSVIDDFCTVYEGLCPASRQFYLPAGAGRQFITHAEIGQLHKRPVADKYHLTTRLSLAHFHGLRDNRYADTAQVKFQLSTQQINQITHHLLFDSAYTSSTVGKAADQTEVKSVQLGYGQDFSLSADLSAVLFGIDTLIWRMTRGQHSRDGGITQQTELHFAQVWVFRSWSARLSSDWRRFSPARSWAKTHYRQHQQSFDAIWTAAGPSSLANLLSYLHVQSVQLGHSRSVLRTTDHLPWQARAQDMQILKNQILITGEELKKGVNLFATVQQSIIKQSAFQPTGRFTEVSLGVKFRF